MANAIRGKKVNNAFIIKPLSRRKVTGRNPVLIERRNLHLLYRFVYYRNNIRNSFAWMIKQLAREFYLSEYTVGKIIQNHAEELHRIRMEKPSAKALRRKYPFFDW